MKTNYKMIHTLGCQIKKMTQGINPTGTAIKGLLNSIVGNVGKCE